ncbi:TOBE domain-containing protein, partial [Rhizobium ruizarguesonis]
YQLITVHRSSGNRTLLDAALSKSNLKLRWSYEVTHLSTSIGVRPENIELGERGAWKGRLRFAENLGNETIAYIDSELGELIIRINGD